MPTGASIRRQILERAQLVRTANGHLTNTLPPNVDGNKTNLMRYIEGKYNKPIDVIIWESSALEVAAKLELPFRTIYNWRKKFPQKEM